MSDLAERFDRENIKFLVSKAITCMRSGEVLDVRTCVVLRDTDGDACIVLSQSGWASLPQHNRDLLAKTHGLTVDPTTVKES